MPNFSGNVGDGGGSIIIRDPHGGLRAVPGSVIGPQNSVDGSSMVKSKSSSKWRLDNEDSLHGTMSQSSLLGSQFARTIAAISQGYDVNGTRAKKSYPPFKDLFWYDKRFNPALEYTHISYEYDAQFKEMEKHWSRAGKKFSDEPRIGKKSLYESPGGPNKKESYANFFELPTKVFPRARELRPFSRISQAHLYNSADVPQKPTPDEETAHLGPGSYDPYPNPWREKSQPICGEIKESSVFKSPDRFPEKKYDPESIDPFRGGSSIVQAEQGVSRDRSRNINSPPRSSMSERQRTAPTPERPPIRPLRSAERAPPTFFRNNPNIAEIHTMREDSVKSVVLQSPIRKPNESSLSRISSASSSFHAMPHTHSAPAAMERSTSSSRAPTLANGKRPATTSQTHGRPPSSPSKVPGFSFLKGKLPPSAIDIVTGTTGADIHYRRVVLADGSTVIVPINGESMENVPKGAQFVKTWGTSHAAEPLLVVAERAPGLPPSSSSPSAPSFMMGGLDSESFAFEGFEGGERDSNYLGEASRMMPGYRGLHTTLSSTSAASSGGVVSVHVSDKPPHNTIFLTPKPVLRESAKRETKMKTLLGFNALNNVSPDAGIGLPPKLADSFAVESPASRPISVKSRQRGGGDVLGLKRPPSVMSRLLQEEELQRKSNELLQQSVETVHDA